MNRFFQRVVELFRGTDDAHAVVTGEGWRPPKGHVEARGEGYIFKEDVPSRTPVKDVPVAETEDSHFSGK